MNQFRPRCSKCASFSVEITLEKVGPWREKTEIERLEFSCRKCGKTLFGRAVHDLITEQTAEWKSKGSSIASEPSVEASIARNRAWEAEQRKIQQRRKDEERARELERWREGLARPEVKVAAKLNPPAKCEWVKCEKPPKEGRRYCSSECSHKKARAVYDEKRKKAQAASRATPSFSLS